MQPDLCGFTYELLSNYQVSRIIKGFKNLDHLNNSSKQKMIKKVKNKKEDLVTSVFVDIEDSTGIANYLEKKAYEDFLSSFHKTIRKVLKKAKWRLLTEEINHKFMGDEFIAFFPHKAFPDEKEALIYALRLASTLKFEWYFSRFNHTRIFGDKEHIELNIGINTGSLSVMRYPILNKKEKRRRISYEGFPITLSKRIQSVAEESQSSRIVVADRFYREYASSTQSGYEFQYMGHKSFKGISQRFACYEWLGDDLYDYLDFRNRKNIPKERNVEKTLIALRDKNPQNPWYASLLANYYFHLAEKEFDRDKYLNIYYDKCADICVNAINNITQYNLRKLNELLFICLEVMKKWDELSFRTKQAFNSDKTFSGALALHAKSVFVQGKLLIEQSKEVADREPLISQGKALMEMAKKVAEEVIVVFKNSLDYDSLFHAHFVLARYYCRKEFVRDKVIENIKEVVEYARRGDIYWAYTEYKFAKDDFKNLENDRVFQPEIKTLFKMWE